MLYIPKIDNYLEILTDEDVKDFVAINFSVFKNLRKVVKLLYVILFLQHLMKYNQILPIIIYVTIMLKF